METPRSSAARGQFPSVIIIPILVLVLVLLPSTAALPRNLPLLSAPENSDSFSPFDLISRDPSTKNSFIITHAQVIARQSGLSSLQIPSCALSCFINTLTTDGCASETDFKCHCTEGNILGKSAACVKKGCPDADAKDAEKKLKAGCASVGVDIGDSGDGDGEGNGGSSTRSGRSSAAYSSTTTSSSASSALPSPSSSSPGRNPSPDEPTVAPAPTPAPTGSPPSSSPTSKPSRSSKTELTMPTDTPLALLPPSSRPLSTSAKVGIGVSVSILFSSLLILVALYIRRLKRELKAAQEAAGIPDEVWRAHIQTSSAAAGGIERSSSNKSSGGGGSIKRKGSWKRRGSIRGRSPPVSPLSPEMTLSFDERGILQKNKRSHVLSIVVERAEEEDSLRTLTVHEPVPGQKEGLVDPLELDSQDVVELPTSITPRTRSRDRERSRSRGSPRTSLESLGRALTRPRGRSFGDRDKDRGESSSEKSRFG